MIKTFASSIDASAYTAGSGTCKGVSLRSINYQTDAVDFQLVKSNDSLHSAVNSVVVADVDQETIAAEIRAVIAAV
jgi:hypothetical protein